MRPFTFYLTFLTCWLLLDRLIDSPPTPGPALTALSATLAVLAASHLVAGTSSRDLITELGLGRPSMRAVAVGSVAGSLVVAALLLGARATDVTLELRANWPAVLAGTIIFHGLAEELVWRGFVFSHLRKTHSFRSAVRRSMPLIAVTHAPIIATSGGVVGGLAMITAAATCVPLSYLWESGRRTIWAPAALHGLIGSWQLFERTYTVQYSLVVLVATICVPMVALIAGKHPAREKTVSPLEHGSPTPSSGQVG